MAEGTAAKPIPGVVGQANNNAAQSVNYGVEGLINHGGEAVAGFSINENGGLGDGVLASSDPSPAPSLANDAVALFAQSTNGTAVYGISDTTSAGYFVNGSTGTDVTVEIKAEGEEFMLNAENTVDGGHVVIDDHGNLILNGHVMTDAASHIAHRARDGQTIDTYAAESSEANVEDDGTATLINGEARVPLEPRFADSIDTSHRYMVFLTPAGDCRGLFVAQRSAAGFVVRELQGGRSTLSFDYRIVARPADATSAARLPASSAAAEFARAESRVRPYSKALNVSHRVQAQNAATSAMGIATH